MNLIKQEPEEAQRIKQELEKPPMFKTLLKIQGG
jgi:hypothetical protein